MKTLLSFILSLFSLVAIAQMPFGPGVMAQSAPAAAAACSTYDTTNSWDNFIEGFQTATTGYESNIWTGVGTTDNITPANNSTSLTSGKPPGACSQCWKIVFPSDGTATYARGDLGAAIDLDALQTDVTFSLYVESGLASGQSVVIFAGGATTTASAYGWGVQYNNNSGDHQLRPLGQAAGTWTTITEGKWYTVRSLKRGTSEVAVIAKGQRVKHVWDSASYLLAGECHSELNRRVIETMMKPRRESSSLVSVRV